MEIIEDGFSVAVYGCDENGDYESDFVELPEKVLELGQPVASYEEAMENAEKISEILDKEEFDFYRVEIWQTGDDGDILESFYKLD